MVRNNLIKSIFNLSNFRLRKCYKRHVDKVWRCHSSRSHPHLRRFFPFQLLFLPQGRFELSILAASSFCSRLVGRQNALNWALHVYFLFCLLVYPRILIHRRGSAMSLYHCQRLFPMRLHLYSLRRCPKLWICQYCFDSGSWLVKRSSRASAEKCS